ncbi:hypothetical protein GTA08_BOTSDO10400 [Neofusicoccum parvum]|uniref:Uncharacterized protein n=1 Tax=Neofusicoccum parvum TaxID=310453 RepID=A0ACB5SGF5_9PEZI|nr:hypothetical protein GTA08_BOTSDO10400 [Neofusicoccum parvum]
MSHDKLEVSNQWIQGWVGGIVTQSLLYKWFPDRYKAVLLGLFGMAVLPNWTEPTKTQLPNALHFRRGIQNTRMRVMGGSGVIMVPQRGDAAGTASIEVLTVEDRDGPGEAWDVFVQKVADAWMKYGYRPQGGRRQLVPKPHWAKEWHGLRLGGRPAAEFLRDEAYCKQISKLKQVLAGIGEEHGWTLDDLKASFSNNMWDDMLWPKGSKSTS